MCSGFWAALNHKIAAFSFTPESINVENIWAYSSDGNFDKALPLCCLKENPLLLGQSMPDAATADFRSGWFAVAQPLYIIFVWSRHMVILEYETYFLSRINY